MCCTREGGGGWAWAASSECSRSEAPAPVDTSVHTHEYIPWNMSYILASILFYSTLLVYIYHTDTKQTLGIIYARIVYRQIPGGLKCAILATIIFKN